MGASHLTWDGDADSAYRAGDDAKFASARAALEFAGFHLGGDRAGAKGKSRVCTYERGGFRFDFLRMTMVDDENYCALLGTRDGVWSCLCCAVPYCELAEFEFVGRLWLKPADHEAYLTAAYGNWRKPDPSHSYTNEDRSIVATTPIV